MHSPKLVVFIENPPARGKDQIPSLIDRFFAVAKDNDGFCKCSWDAEGEERDGDTGAFHDADIKLVNVF